MPCMPKTALDIAQDIITSGIQEKTGAAFVSQCFKEAEINFKGLPFPLSSSADVIRRAFRATHRLSKDPQAMMAWKGAIAGYKDKEGGSNVFIVARRMTSHGNILAIKTVEGSPESEDGLVTRVVPIDDGHTLWFGDTSDIAGGSWWPT